MIVSDGASAFGSTHWRPLAGSGPDAGPLRLSRARRRARHRPLARLTGHLVGAAVLGSADAVPCSPGRSRIARNTSAKSWYAPCAWDAFGIPGGDRAGRAHRGPVSGIGRAAAVRRFAHGRAYGLRRHPPRGARSAHSGTTSSIPERTSCSSGRKRMVNRWCGRRRVARGALMTIAQAWDLSQKWYGTRLDPDFRRPTIDRSASDLRRASVWSATSGRS